MSIRITPSNGASGALPLDATGSAEGDDIVTATNGAFELSEDGTFRFVSTDAASTPLMLRLASSHTANAFEVQTDAGTPVAQVNPDGRLALGSGVSLGATDAIKATIPGNAVYTFGAAANLTAIFDSGSSTRDAVLSFRQGGTPTANIRVPASTSRLELLNASSTARVGLDGTGIGFFGAATAPVAQQAHPGTASGTDAAVINAIRDALINYGLLAAS